MKKHLLKDILPSKRSPIKKDGWPIGDEESDIKKEREERMSLPIAEKKPINLEEETIYYHDTEDPFEKKTKNKDSKRFPYNAPNYSDGNLWVDEHSHRTSRIVLWAIAVVALIALGLVFSYFFSSAKLVLYPKIESRQIESSVVIGKEDCLCEKDAVFKTVTLEKEFIKEIPAGAEKYVERKASGSIVIYNNYSTSPQRLIKNTRFEAPGGLIYRIDTSVVVPGMTNKDGKKIPGSLEAKVYADFPGTEYNINYVDFTVPGFKSDAGRYAGFYARSKTQMSGGLIGKIKTVSDSNMTNAKNSLQREIRDGIQQGIIAKTASLSGQFTVPNDLLFVFFEDVNTLDSSTEDKVIIKQKAKGVGIALDNQSLDNALLKDDGSKVKETLYLKDGKGLSFVLQKNLSNYEDAIAVKNLNLTVKGQTDVVFGIDKDKFLSDVKGLSKNKVEKMIQEKYNNIVTVNIGLKPFWAFRVPADKDKISLQIELDRP